MLVGEFMDTVPREWLWALSCSFTFARVVQSLTEIIEVSLPIHGPYYCDLRALDRSSVQFLSRPGTKNDRLINTLKLFY
jgi:hypothetical protein